MMITRIIKKLGNKNNHSIAEARVFAEKIVREQFEFEFRKHGIKSQSLWPERGPH